MSEVVKATAWMTGENCDADVRDALRGTLESLALGAAENCIEVVAPDVYFFYFPCLINNRVQPMGECPRWGFVVQDLLTLQELARYRYRIPIRSVCAVRHNIFAWHK